jgi:hypothetical protein
MSVLLSVVAALVFIGLIGFLWFWWAAPRDQVPPHFTETDLRRLEVQDRLRQTNYQVLTAAALGATFLATMVQFGTTTRQWAADYELKLGQERLTQYTETMKTIGNGASKTTQLQLGIANLQLLAIQDPARFHQQASEVFTQLTVDNHTDNHLTPSLQCEDHVIPNRDPPPYDRDEAPDALKAAMKALGHPQFAAYRLNYSVDKCDQAEQTFDHAPLFLEHMSLDNLDLSGRDFSCSKMSQSRFHRTSFAGADLRGADLRGTQLADFSTPGFPADKYKGKFYSSEADGGPLEWQRYRCWVADFRYAKLQDATFEGAYVAGADFSNADLSGADFCRADVSRANFSGAKGLKPEMLADACVGTSIDLANPNTDPNKKVIPEDQPFGIAVLGKDFQVKRCLSTKVCGH